MENHTLHENIIVVYTLVFVNSWLVDNIESYLFYSEVSKMGKSGAVKIKYFSLTMPISHFQDNVTYIARGHRMCHLKGTFQIS